MMTMMIMMINGCGHFSCARVPQGAARGSPKCPKPASRPISPVNRVGAPPDRSTLCALVQMRRCPIAYPAGRAVGARPLVLIGLSSLNFN